MAHRRFAVLLALVGLLLPGAAAAICDVTYKTQAGDTLLTVAERHYGDAQRWTLIYYANQDVLSGQQVAPGTDLYIPCTGAMPTTVPDAAGLARDMAADATPAPDPEPEAVPEPAPAPSAGRRADLVLLTGGNYMPFADRAWPEQGLAVELVSAALQASPSPVAFEVMWEDDWSRHLFPLLDEKQRDMGFPWVKPDCAATPEAPRCSQFHYSEPLMDLPVMLFKRADADLVYADDADLAGRTLCRPVGFFTHDLDRADRRWLSEGVIDLLRPATSEACFEALMAGEVDAVSVNVFLGAAKVVSMGLRGKVVPIDTPLSRETLHVVISKTHPRGTTHLYRVNAGLAALRESGQYTEIVARHMEIFWERLN